MPSFVVIWPYVSKIELKKNVILLIGMQIFIQSFPVVKDDVSVRSVDVYDEIR